MLPPPKLTSSVPVPFTGPIVCATGSAILIPFKENILFGARSKFSEETQVLYVTPLSVPFHLIDLSVLPFTIKPPSSAAPSEGPIAVMVACPLPVTLFDKTAALFVIETIIVLLGIVIPPVDVVTVMPGIKPAVGVIDVMFAVPLVTVATNCVLTTAASSIFLSVI